MMQRIDRDTLLRRFRVDLQAGKIFWKIAPHTHPRLANTEAGGARENRGKQYWVIKIKGEHYKRARLVFLAAHGRLPMPCVDHINGNSLDDSVANLREATVLENSWNHKNHSRRVKLPMGVRLVASSGRYQARISFCGQQLHLGAYDTPEEASAIYEAKRKELFREFA